MSKALYVFYSPLGADGSPLVFGCSDTPLFIEQEERSSKISVSPDLIRRERRVDEGLYDSISRGGKPSKTGRIKRKDELLN